MTTIGNEDLKSRIIESITHLGGLGVKTVDIQADLFSVTTGQRLDNSLDELMEDGIISRKRGVVSICDMKKANLLKDTSTGDWGDEQVPLSKSKSLFDWTKKDHVQALWNGKWYWVQVLTKKSDGTYNVLFNKTNNEAFVPVRCLRINTTDSFNADPNDDTKADADLPSKRKKGGGRQSGTLKKKEESLEHHIHTYGDSHDIHIVDKAMHKPDTPVATYPEHEIRVVHKTATMIMEEEERGGIEGEAEKFIEAEELPYTDASSYEILPIDLPYHN